MSRSTILLYAKKRLRSLAKSKANSPTVLRNYAIFLRYFDLGVCAQASVRYLAKRSRVSPARIPQIARNVLGGAAKEYVKNGGTMRKWHKEVVQRKNNMEINNL